MTLQDLPSEVQHLIASLDSTDQLEVLLLLLQSPSQIHNVDSIARTLGLSYRIIETALRGLQTHRLVATVSAENSQVSYQYAPATIELHAAVEGLALAYSTHSVVVIKALREKPDQTLRVFADAFRIRGQNNS